MADASGATLGVPIRGARVNLRLGEDVPARTRPEATSPETDTPARFFAEICYLLYQGTDAQSSSMWGFQRVFSGVLPVT